MLMNILRFQSKRAFSTDSDYYKMESLHYLVKCSCSKITRAEWSELPSMTRSFKIVTGVL